MLLGIEIDGSMYVCWYVWYVDKKGLAPSYVGCVIAQLSVQGLVALDSAFSTEGVVNVSSTSFLCYTLLWKTAQKRRIRLAAATQ